MGSSSNDRFTAGTISWYDVKAFMEEIAKAHNGSVWVVSGLRPLQNRQTMLYWSVKFRYGAVGHDFMEQYAERHDWPAGDWKTVPNMLYALLARLDYKITEAERKAEAQASF